MKDLVSVIITTYKRSELLPRAIDSVLAQSYENIELLVVDDNDPGSEYRKATENLITTRYSQEPKVRYIKMPKNSGSCPARAQGVFESKGEYINFLDDDDEFHPTKIEQQMKVFAVDTEKKLAAVGCYANVVDGAGRLRYVEKVDVKGNVFFYQMCDNVTTTSIVLIRKSVYVASGGFQTMYSCQEHWMLIRLFSVCPYYDYVPEVLINIYQHEGARISNNNNWGKGAIQLYDNAAQFFERFTPEQVKIIKKRMNAHIINNLYICNEGFKARKYTLQRLKIGGKITMEDCQLYMKFIFGCKIYQYFWNTLLAIKHHTIDKLK